MDHYALGRMPIMYFYTEADSPLPDIEDLNLILIISVLIALAAFTLNILIVVLRFVRNRKRNSAENWFSQY